MPLTPRQLELVRATIPILETGGEVLTKHFYGVMLGEYPEVVPFFNKTHQAKGFQPRALAHAVLMYAKHIEHLENIGALAGQIIQKHVSLAIKAEHYPIVGKCLLRAMVEVLGKDVATDEILDAWGAAYQQLADILIAAEEAQYQKIESAPGGWRGEREFVISKKEVECDAISSFYLSPVDGGEVLAYQSGQYTCVVVTVNGESVRRNYSLSNVSNGTGYRISVKHENDGIVSGYLHSLKEGDKIALLPPAGEFTLGEESTKPVVFIAGGIGITPLLAMMKTVLTTTTRSVTFLSCVKDAAHQAFQGELEELRSLHGSRVQVDFWYSATSGRITAERLAQTIPADHDAEVYCVGPREFMKDVKHQVVESGVPEKQFHYEFFGPAAQI